MASKVIKHVLTIAIDGDVTGYQSHLHLERRIRQYQQFFGSQRGIKIVESNLDKQVYHGIRKLRWRLLFFMADALTARAAEYVGFVESDTLFFTQCDLEDLFEDEGKKAVIHASKSKSVDAGVQWLMKTQQQQSLHCAFFPFLVRREHIREMREYWINQGNFSDFESLLRAFTANVYFNHAEPDSLRPFDAVCAWLWRFHREDYAWYIDPAPSSASRYSNSNNSSSSSEEQPPALKPKPKPRIALHAMRHRLGAPLSHVVLEGYCRSGPFPKENACLERACAQYPLHGVFRDQFSFEQREFWAAPEQQRSLIASQAQRTERLKRFPLTHTYALSSLSELRLSCEPVVMQADDAMVARELGRLLADYEASGLSHVKSLLQIHYNASSNCTYCVAATESLSRPKAVLLVVYQEIRSFHLALRTIKENVIDVLEGRYAVKLALLFRQPEEFRSDLSIVLDALARLRLLSHVLTVKFNSQVESRRLRAQLSEELRGNESPNKAGPLFEQYAQRYMACLEARRIIADGLSSGDEIIEFVFLLRSDVFVPHVDLSFLLAQPQRQRNGRAEALVHVPFEEDWGGVNDRFAIFSRCGFMVYAGRLLDAARQHIREGRPVGGEVIHRRALQMSPPVLVRRIAICYGVFRIATCTWTVYGEEDCKRVGRVSVGLNYSFLHDEALHCEKDLRYRAKDGEAVRSKAQKQVFYIANGTRHAVKRMADLGKRGIGPGNVREITPFDLASIPRGGDLR